MIYTQQLACRSMDDASTAARSINQFATIDRARDDTELDLEPTTQYSINNPSNSVRLVGLHTSPVGTDRAWWPHQCSLRSPKLDRQTTATSRLHEAIADGPVGHD